MVHGIAKFQGNIGGDRANGIEDTVGHLYDVSSDHQDSHGFTNRAPRGQQYSRNDAATRSR